MSVRPVSSTQWQVDMEVDVRDSSIKGKLDQSWISHNMAELRAAEFVSGLSVFLDLAFSSACMHAFSDHCPMIRCL